jgi:hypothetical protein
MSKGFNGRTNLHVDFGWTFIPEMQMSSRGRAFTKDDDLAAKPSLSVGRSSISVLCRSTLGDSLSCVHADVCSA